MRRIVRRSPPLDGSCHLPGSLHPVLRQVYLARRVSSPAELDLSLARLQPAAGLSGIEEAAELLSWALRQRKRILIVGDFDADGATSCALAVRGLRALGAPEVGYLVPDRFRFGYGLSPQIVAAAATRSPDLLVTVDNGISSLEGVAAARRGGFKVLVTDHHLPARQLPDADAIVNPNLPGDRFASKSLAGVGVMFYVLAALRARLGSEGWFASGRRESPNLAQFLDLVALGTIADLVPLDHNNRILVEQGIRRIRAGSCCPGILALLELGSRDCADLVSADLGFVVAPRLNAAGRLEDMGLGIECLLSEDPASARATALRLDGLNAERREIEQRMRQEAFGLVEALDLGDGSSLPYTLCLFDESWHQGVVGLLASRLKERYHRPAIGFAPGEGGEVKGSARSVPGFHIRDALERVASEYPGLLQRFGGHAMAAGLSLARDRLEEFTAAFETEARRQLSPEDLEGVVHSDGELAAQDLCLDLAELLRASGPWGQGFPAPVFDGVFGVVEQRVLGERHLKMLLRASGEGPRIDAIAFNVEDGPLPRAGEAVRLAYRLEVNHFRGSRSAQIQVEHFEGTLPGLEPGPR